MKKAGMPLFGLDQVLPCFAGREVEGKDMRVPIGHGDGAFFFSSTPIMSLLRKHPPCFKPPRRSRDLASEKSDI